MAVSSCARGLVDVFPNVVRTTHELSRMRLSQQLEILKLHVSVEVDGFLDILLLQILYCHLFLDVVIIVSSATSQFRVVQNVGKKL